MKALAARIILLWGWQKWVVAALAGALSALALPPYGFPPVLAFTIPVLVWLIDGAIASNRRRHLRLIWPAFGVGWWFGFGYFLAGLNWIGHAFLVDRDTFGWLMPIAVIAMPAGLALFFGAGTALARLLWSDTPWRIFALAFSLGLSEWLRGHILTGFPWNLPGYALTVHDWPMQMAALIGVYGLTVMVLLMAAAPATLGDDRARVIPSFMALIALATMIGFGGYRLHQAGDIALSDTKLRLVQPNIAQAEKWRPENRAAIFADYLALSRSTDTTIDAVIWPESAVPFFLNDTPGALGAIAEMLPIGRYLITGSNRIGDTGPDGTATYFNSAFVIDDAGGVIGRYDKNHLVPFGEVLPFERTLDKIGLRKLVTLPGSFSPGRRADVIKSGSLPPVRILICYEVIFSGAIFSADTPLSSRPEWLLNLTNDAWFGQGAGPRQHLHHARVRAVEEGLPLVRVANTGISAMIGPYGRLRESMASDIRKTTDVQLPISLTPTFFARQGSIMIVGLLAISAALALFGKVLGNRQKKMF